MKRPSWNKHPSVRSDDQLTMGERLADHMKAVLATWTALVAVLTTMLLWMATNGFSSDLPPWIGLNLGLSAFAAVQCFLLLIAAKRSDRIAYEVAMSTLRQVQAVEARVNDISNHLSDLAEVMVEDERAETNETANRLDSKEGSK